MVTAPWSRRLRPEEAAKAFRQALEANLISPDDTALVFHDLALMKSRIQQLVELFGTRALHAVAIKANPLVEVLRHCVEAGAGLEAASLGEVELAVAAGCPPSKIVFDSPVKTEAELARALELGVILNADNDQELERLHPHNPTGLVGLRINPVVGRGTIKAQSVATRDSKFGFPIYPEAEPAKKLFRQYPWLNGLHVHVGSQGCGLELLVAGARRAMDLAAEVGPLAYLDIGGGLPTTYRSQDDPPTMEAYREELERQIPELFQADAPRLVTEFGRALQAGCGFALARVEYIKQYEEIRTALVHLGGDALVRTIYLPQTWQHELAVLTPDGTVREGPEHQWNIGGPLCFNGDFVAKGRLLPDPEPGDWILIRDAGAYTLAVWSHFCSRPFPTVIGLEGEKTSLLRQRQSTEDLVRFWSL